MSYSTNTVADSARLPKLALTAITKTFPGVKALSRVSFTLYAGEVHALCGENGAGKSTLMNILSGNLQPDSGQISLNGLAVSMKNQQEAQRQGIAIVYQERSLINDLSVAENIFAGRQPVNRFGFIDRKQLHRQTRRLLDKLEMHHVAPNDRAGDLSPAIQQMLEIAKALSHQPDILILDEPTASITEKETATLFRLIRQMRSQGIAVIYISHRMAEIFEIADRVSVLKDGVYQGTRELSAITVDDIIRMMVGRDLKAYPYQPYFQEATVLEVTGLSGPGFTDVSFSLKRGELLGFAGLVGAGRTELARAMIGADPTFGGEIRVKGQLAEITHPADAIAHSIGYLPENRKDQGLFLEMELTDNIIAATLPKVAHYGMIRNGAVTEICEQFRQQLNIKTPSIYQKAVNLSGGNQQKVMLARWLMCNPDVLIVDEPTHGVDVGAKSEIYLMLQKLLREGISIILISSELPELLSLCDRILVMCQGRLTAELNRHQADEHTVMQYASGLKNMFGPLNLPV